MSSLAQIAITIRNRYDFVWKIDKSFWLNMGVALFLLLCSLLINSAANHYTETHASNPVTDIILNHIPVYNVNFIFIDGMVTFWVVVGMILLQNPKWIPFSIKSIAIFVLIRSFFITLTHLGPPAHHLALDMDHDGLIAQLTSDDDLFFSAHTGMPFLMALVFWEHKALRLFCLFCTALFGVSVLLGHLHYSIDVFSAFFITFSIFELVKYLFPKDYALFHQKQPECKGR